MTYFIRRGDQQYGPYTLGDLQRYVASGHISAEDEAYTEGGGAAGRVGALLAQPQAEPSPFAPVGGAAAADPSASPFGSPQPASPMAIPSGAYLPAYQKPRMANGAPLPPDFHWGWLLLLHIPTCGMITFVWLFLQAWWVRQLDRENRAVWYFAGNLGLSYLVGLPLNLTFSFMSESDDVTSPELIFVLIGVYLLVVIGGLVLFVIGAFSMRRSMLNYFNSVENINLRLNGVMTFFFPIWYFQYHMSRIAQWKKTGMYPM
jgi:hypothetical protein